MLCARAPAPATSSAHSVCESVGCFIDTVPCGQLLASSVERVWCVRRVFSTPGDPSPPCGVASATCACVWCGFRATGKSQALSWLPGSTEASSSSGAARRRVDHVVAVDSNSSGAAAVVAWSANSLYLPATTKQTTKMRKCLFMPEHFLPVVARCCCSLPGVGIYRERE